VCGDAACQRRRRNDYHRRKIAADPEYRQVCLDSPQKWRSRNPDYWRQYRERHPEAVERNRQQQHVRDQKQRLRDLANNNSAPAQVWILEPLPPRKPPQSESCKQQRPGNEAASAG